MTSTFEMTPQTTQPEHEPRSIERFFVLDFDRTLIDTDLLAEKIYNVVEMRTNLHKEDLKAEQHRLEENGETGVVDMWKVIGDALSTSSEELDELRDNIIDTVRKNATGVWLVGAPELLELLEHTSTDFGILSRGAEGWQRLKLACMGLEEVPAIITGGHHKSRDHLNEWFDEDRSAFIVPADLTTDGQAIAAENIISVDDRASAFADVRDRIFGYWVRTGRYTDPTDINYDRVRACDNLDTVVADLRVRYFSDAA